MERNDAEVTRESVLHDLQMFPLDLGQLRLLCLQQHHIVRLLSGFAPAKDAVNGQPLLQVLPRVDDQGYVDIVEGGELPEHLNALILLGVPVKIAVPGCTIVSHTILKMVL